MTTLRLLPHQEECLSGMVESLNNGINTQLISLPQGAGKPVVFAKLTHQTNQWTLIFAHTNELLEAVQLEDVNAGKYKT